MVKRSTLVGRRVTIPAGTRITSGGRVRVKSRTGRVTVRRVSATRTGNTRVYWKSNGLLTSAVL